jgi:hypothetical protein
VSDLLGNDFGTHEQEQLEEFDDLEPSYDGESSDGVYIDEAELMQELVGLRTELEEVRRENDGLLVEKDTAGEIILNLRRQLQDSENDTRGSDQRVRRGGPVGQADGNEPAFGSLGDWVQAWLLPLYRRELDGRSTTFCVHWWRHPEAYFRLDALWKSWEFMRLKPGTGTAVWLKDYLDPHMAVLMSSNGPMHGCTLKKHSDNATEPWALSRLPTAGELAWIYRVTGEGGFTTADRFERIEAVPWDGKDQR